MKMKSIMRFLSYLLIFAFRKVECQRGDAGGELLNPFEADAFSMANLCAAIEILPNLYGRVNQLGVFNNVEGITTRTAIVEEYSGVLNLLKTMPVGAPGNNNKIGKRTVRSFTVPHIPLDDIIRPEEFSGIREFGQPNQMKTLATVMNRHLQTAKNKFAITLENLRMGALKGIILDADGSTLYNLYTEFGIVAQTVSFALMSGSPLAKTTTTDVAKKCREVLRWIETHLLGEVMTDVRCLCSQEFFDALIGNTNVEKYYLNWTNAAQIAGTDPRKGFPFGGIIFEEYLGVATDETGTSRRFIAEGEAHCFPMGTMNTFKQIYAPGNFLETVNTPGLELYAKQVIEDMARWVDLHIESNPLPLCCRPATLVKLTMT